MMGEIEGIKIYVNDETYTKYKKTLEDEIDELQQENKILKENAEHNDKVVDKVNWENMLLKKENKQLKDLIDTILKFSLFKEECPLNFSFEDNSKEDEAQNIFYNDEYCENNCNDNYKDCWLKYFKELQKTKGDVKNGSEADDKEFVETILDIIQEIEQGSDSNDSN